LVFAIPQEIADGAANAGWLDRCTLMVFGDSRERGAGMSHSRFSNLFSSGVGETLSTYLTNGPPALNRYCLLSEISV